MRLMLALLMAGVITGTSHAATLDRVRAAQTLACGAITEPGDYDKDDTHGNTEAFGEDICRAVAAAVLGDPARATTYGFKSEAEGMAAVRSGQVSLLVGATPNPGYARRYGVAFGQPVFFDGQGFLVRRDAGIASLADLSGKPVCFIGDTDAEASAHRVLEAKGIRFLPFPFEEVGEMEAALVTGHCRAETGDASKIAYGRTGFHGQVHDFVLLPELITLDPLSPVVLQGDDTWLEIVNWTMHTLVQAEILGVTQANAHALAVSGNDGEVRALLGDKTPSGWALGLQGAWGLRVIEAVGNYGEAFERDLGAKSAVGLSRGVNKPWTQGGLLWSPAFR